MLEHIMNRLKLLFGIGTVTIAGTKIIQVKSTLGVSNDKIKRAHNYGFMSRPLVGARAYTAFIGGDVSKGISILVEDERYEIELQPGEVAILDDKGNLVHMTDTGIKVTSPTKVEITTPQAIINAETTINGDTTINGETTLSGKTTATGGMTIDGISFGTHSHNEHDGPSTGGPKQ